MSRLYIILASKTENQSVKDRTPVDPLPAEAPDNEPYACFVARKDEIAAWLRSGYSIKGVWTACRRATPPFEGSYQTFWRYCRMHGLSVSRGGRPAIRSEDLPQAKSASGVGSGTGSSPKIWPRLRGKPAEFIPSED